MISVDDLSLSRCYNCGFTCAAEFNNLLLSFHWKRPKCECELFFKHIFKILINEPARIINLHQCVQQ